MELRQHFGILVILILVTILIWAYGRDWEKGYKIYVPIGAASILWCIFEVFYWVLTLLIF